MSSSQSQPLSPPKDLWHLLSKETQNRQASNIKQFYKYFSIPGIGQLAGGLPSPNYFPFDDLISDAAVPDRFTPTPNKPVDPPTSLSDHLNSIKLSPDPASSRLLVPHESGDPDRTRKVDLATALQYGTAEGYPPLRQWLLRFVQEHMHPNIPYAGGPNIVLTCGSTDGFSKCMQLINNTWIEGRDAPTEREGLLCEEYAYMGAIQMARPRGVNILAVAIDDEGMLADGPGGLRDVLQHWDPSRGKRPHMLYTVTIGQNPTSGVLSLPRRQQIYDLCCEYDIMIIEDDPYWFLQYPSASSSSSSPSRPSQKSTPTTGYAFLDSLVPSYLSVDTHGRVLRLDTFSKTIAPGCRLGWITAQPALIERLLRITESTTQQPSGFVQSMVAELLVGPPGAPSTSQPTPGVGGGKSGTGFGFDGWVRWLEGLRGEYERRMNVMSDILTCGQTRIKSGRRPSLTLPVEDDAWTVVETDSKPLYTFQKPMGGMFLWVGLNFETHPLWSSLQKENLTPAQLSRALWILWTRKPMLVLVSPGEIFAPTEEVKRDAWRYFRLCFAAADREEIQGLSERWVRGVHRFWGIRDAAVVKELLASDEQVVAEGGDVGVGLWGFC
ncbi:MAG: hypothetical protein Q9162_000368 [Coniocarpon cinnabarinum]